MNIVFSLCICIPCINTHILHENSFAYKIWVFLKIFFNADFFLLYYGIVRFFTYYLTSHTTLLILFNFLAMFHYAFQSLLCCNCYERKILLNIKREGINLRKFKLNIVFSSPWIVIVIKDNYYIPLFLENKIPKESFST